MDRVRQAKSNHLISTADFPLLSSIEQYFSLLRVPETDDICSLMEGRVDVVTQPKLSMHRDRVAYGLSQSFDKLRAESNHLAIIAKVLLLKFLGQVFLPAIALATAGLSPP